MCAAGLTGPTADDVAKEVAIYRAHKAAPVVIATEGEERFSARHAGTCWCPRRTRPGLRAVGHGRSPVRLRGRPGHRRPGPPPARGPGRDRGGGVVGAAGPRSARDGDRSARPPGAHARAGGRPASSTGCAPGDYDGHLEASTAVRLASLLRYATGHAARSRATRSSTARSARPACVVEDLIAALTRGHRGADPAHRRHQAPGQDGHRRASPAARRPAAGAAGGGRARRRAWPATSSATGSLRTLADARPGRGRGARLHPLPHRGPGRRRATPASVVVIDRGGISPRAASADRAQPALRGTKHRVADEREVTVARGRSDGRTAGHRARGQGQAGHRADPAARPVPRPPAPSTMPRRCCPATGAGSPPSRTR